MKSLSTSIGLAVLLSTTSANAFVDQSYERHARVSLKEARAIAVKARPGKITDQELEHENGGSGLRYSFDIKNRQRTYEVGVDANSGKVLENKVEGPNPD